MDKEATMYKRFIYTPTTKSILQLRNVLFPVWYFVIIEEIVA